MSENVFQADKKAPNAVTQVALLPLDEKDRRREKSRCQTNRRKRHKAAINGRVERDIEKKQTAIALANARIAQRVGVSVEPEPVKRLSDSKKEKFRAWRGKPVKKPTNSASRRKETRQHELHLIGE